ncbi:MAG: hypothetical protein BWZ07_03374 [Alphaproteobacteria bacterium ADurb.BinA280]|nr:MAG: hypothetical protein BWZ07_03374 [Alphaproteobacteria bacterium ADurb.BinA280]
MIAGVRHIQRILPQRQPTWQVETGIGQPPINEARATCTELAQDAAIVRALQNPVVSGIADVQVTIVGSQAGRKRQRHAGLLLRGIRHRVVDPQIGLTCTLQHLLDERIQTLTGRIPNDGLNHLAFGIQQDHRRPDTQTIVLPSDEVGILHDRKTHGQAIDRFEHQFGIALGIELGGMHAQHAQAVGVLLLQLT